MTHKKDWKKVIEEAEGQNEQVKIAAEEQPRGLEHPEYQELEKKLTEAEKKVNEYWNDLLRTRAEMENVRRRAELDVTNAHKYGLKKLIVELLPVIDSIEHGLNAIDANNESLKPMRQGMELTLDLFFKTLDKFGVTAENPVGKEFNPDLHQAMCTEENKEVKPNTVLNVMQKGYLLNGRLIRPAMVVVAKA